MSVSPLRPIHRFMPGATAPHLVVPPKPTLQTLSAKLMQDGVVKPHVMLQVIAQQPDRRRHLVDMLLARRAASPEDLYDAIGTHWGVGHVDLQNTPPDPRLTAAINPVTALRDGLLPWRKMGQATVIVTAYPDLFHRHRNGLKDRFGAVAMAVAPLAQIETALLATHGGALAHASETRVPASESCRAYHSTTLQRPAALLAAILAIMAMLQPVMALTAVFGIALLAMFSHNIMKLIALILMARSLPEPQALPVIAHLPVVSVMVALYRESNIAARLVKRLGRLDYPPELLDVILVVEAEDTVTREALAKAELPASMRVVLVPAGTVKTKPRALNYALDHCRGSIVGVYDAEDAPEPDQIRKVVNRFHCRGPDLACLQGRLDFYNPRINWFSRCFTIEYAAWFRLLLPGIERLGLAVPLGGTTLFFRRKVLEELGRWDAHNVTEDADLGMRIARRGYRTELLDTTTFEEANCRPRSWVKQRSRWIKGFMMTWLTHMRDPRLLWRELGPRRFLGFQLLLAGSVLQSLLAPVLWSFWLVPFGFHHPAVDMLSPGAFGLLWKTFLIIEGLTLAFGIAGNAKTRHGLSPLWVPTLICYYPLATLAAYKAAWEMLVQPFYWDKTSHGEFDHVT